MHTAGHTPGPWLREGNLIYALTHHGWRKGVEQFRNRMSFHFAFDNSVSAEEEEATITLAAAAPALLEALERLTREANRMGPQLPYNAPTADLSQAIEAARAAIHAATGEDQ